MCESGTDFVTISKVAQLLNMTEIQILMMIENSELQGKIVNDVWHVYRSSIQLRSNPENSGIPESGGCGICGTRCGSGC